MSYRIITAFFSVRGDADGALERLAALGVAPSDVSFIPKTLNRRDDIGLRNGTKACKGAAIGAVAGGSLGAIVGALCAAGSMVMPLFGAVVAGPLVAACAGSGALGALGIALGALLGSRVPEFEATYLTDAIAMGGSIVGVRCRRDAIPAVEAVLTASGARPLRHAEAKGHG